MKAALKRGVDSGELVQVKASYKLAPGAKKKSTASSKAKPTVKKASKATGESKKVCICLSSDVHLPTFTHHILVILRCCFYYSLRQPRRELQR